jgi:hypothetical protein
MKVSYLKLNKSAYNQLNVNQPVVDESFGRHTNTPSMFHYKDTTHVSQFGKQPRSDIAVINCYLCGTNLSRSPVRSFLTSGFILRAMPPDGTDRNNFES